VLWELMTPPARVVSKRDLSGKLSERDGTLRGLGYVLEEGR
jgi:hypothetical protein